MTFETTEDLPRQYQELADDAGFQSVFNSLEAAPADMAAVAEVEKRVERVEDQLPLSIADKWDIHMLRTEILREVFDNQNNRKVHRIRPELLNGVAVKTSGWVGFLIGLSLVLGAINTYGIFF